MHVKSHEYELGPWDWARLGGGPLLAAIGFAVCMHGGAGLGMLPAPRPTLDADRTILARQVDAARTAVDPEIVLVGDSSCLMDVDARRLGEGLGRSVLNLGALSYLDVAAFAALIQEHLKSRPSPPAAIVLLMHPEALRRQAGGEQHERYERLFQALLRGENAPELSGPRDRILWAFGMIDFRDRFLSRLVPTPLAGAFGEYYGFTADLERFLERRRGSAVDPRAEPFEGNAEYRLASQVEQGSEIFRETVPSGTRLLAGITPAPEGFIGPDYAKTRDRMLTEWAGWLGADAALFGLPPTLPDERFATVAHLNERGMEHYTRLLEQELNRLLARSGP